MTICCHEGARKVSKSKWQWRGDVVRFLAANVKASSWNLEFGGGIDFRGSVDESNHRRFEDGTRLGEAGTFTMGSSLEEPERNKAEGPQTRVTISKGFWLGKMEVTQGQYEAITGGNPSTFKDLGKDAPVERVSWIDAMAFCEKLNERERTAGRLLDGYAYTLPTEAEWEYAYRTGTTAEYPSNVEAMAWHKNNSGETTHLVGQRAANAWGFYDMAGNVLEWCYDWYGNYPGGAMTDPTGPRRGYYRTARGGSWRVDLRVCRSAARSGGSAARQDYTMGFRLALCPVRTD